MSKLHQLADLGQSIWLDYIRRAFLTSGELQELVQQGIRGVTSNPSIFEKAIAGSADYDVDLRRLVESHRPVDEIYESLAIEDIQRAADLLRPVYDSTAGADGYVSLEVSPTLAHDTQGTVAEARRLFATLDRPNVMIKIPATAAGVPAIETAIGEGINVNVTLIFSLAHYEAVAGAYLRGLQKLAESGGNLGKVASVASFFVSRVDTAVDRQLDVIGTPEAQALKGKIAVANARLAYARFRRLFSGDKWDDLATRGARVQRPLWASTATKNPLYADTLYVDSLIAPDTVNTVPPATLNAFLDHGTVAVTMAADAAEAAEQINQLKQLGVDLDAITDKLQEDGVASFAKSFEVLMSSIAAKRDRLLAGKKSFAAGLGKYQEAVDAALAELRDHHIVARIWAHDFTVWKSDPTEISNRLGWLHSPDVMLEAIPSIQAFVDGVRKDGYTHVLLLGMGGSSLAPEMFRKTFGVASGHLDLSVLDSTDPGAVLAVARRLDPSKTLFIVSTKSGGTVETLSFFKYFYNQTLDAVGARNAGAHFAAITDPGSKLEEIAGKHSFRAIFLNDPNIGGRYSALSYFGLVPAALVGVDLETLLQRASTMACNCESANCPVAGDNTGARLGAVMGELAAQGRDKVTLVTSPAIAPFGAWVEQLIAESTGKDGTGILPVDGETLGPPDSYAADRLFVYPRLEEDDTHDAAVQALAEAGHPVVWLHLHDLFDLGGEFFRWEIATVIAGRRLGINPFDQPNVEAAKVQARKMVAAYQETGSLPEPEPSLIADGMAVYTDTEAETLESAIKAFLGQAQPGAYVALQAYVPPNEPTSAALQTLRLRLRDRLKLATTVGYGPRFLHSTGQLHKGDAGKGLFIQLTSDPPEDVPIPDQPGSLESSITFGVLIKAQALGDRQALLDNGRKVIRLHMAGEVVSSLARLTEAIR